MKKLLALVQRRPDIAAIIAVLFFAAGIIGVRFWNGSRGEENDLFAVIYVDGKAQKKQSLSADAVFSLPGHPAVQFEVRNRSCAFVHSDCPDQICVHSGFLRAPGQSASCLPNRITLRIERADDPGQVGDALDAVAQ